MNEELKEKLVLTLGSVYARAGWKELKIQRSAYDFFNDKIKVSTSEPDFVGFLEKLMLRMKVKTPGVDLEIIEELQKHSKIILKELRRSTYSYWGLKGALKGKEIKERWNIKEEEK